MAGGIFGEDHAAEASDGEGMAGVIEVDGVGLAGAEGAREVNEDSSGVALVFQLGRAEKDLIDVQGVAEVDLDAAGVLEHLKRMVFLPVMVCLSGSTRMSRW